MQKLALARNGEMTRVNDFAKAAKGKPLDPAAFCSISQGLLHAEDALIGYMVKNKDWCSFPEEAIDNLKTGHSKNAGFSSKACTVAAKIKKMKEQAASNNSAAGPQAARPSRRTALTPGAERAGVLPDARPQSLILRLTP